MKTTRKSVAYFGWIFALTVLLSGSVSAQGTRKDGIVFNSRGVPASAAVVRVCTSSATGQPCSPLANIYSDSALTQLLANPLNADALGNYFFYAAPGTYELEFSGPSIETKQIPDVLLPASSNPGGSNTQVQFNDNGSFNGAAALTYDKTTQELDYFNTVDSGNIDLIVSNSGGSTGEINAQAGDDVNKAVFIAYLSHAGNGGVWASDFTGITGQAFGSSNVTLDAPGGAVIVQKNLGTLGFFGSSGTAKLTIIGSQNGNTALGSLLSALAGYGLLVDGTSAGSPPPAIVFTNTQTGKTSAIADSTMVTPEANTSYRFSGNVSCDSSSAAATVTLNLKFTDVSNTAQTLSATATCTTLGSSSIADMVRFIRAKSGVAVTFGISIANTPTYDVDVRLETM